MSVKVLIYHNRRRFRAGRSLSPYCDRLRQAAKILILDWYAFLALLIWDSKCKFPLRRLSM